MVLPRQGPRDRFVVRQFADRAMSLYSPTPGHETVRVLLILALRENLAVRCGDISVAFMITPMACTVIGRWSGGSGGC